MYAIYKFNYKYIKDNLNKELILYVERVLNYNEEKKEYLVKYKNDRFILKIYSDDNIKLEYKDIVKVYSSINIPQSMKNPYEFNYKRYLNSNSIIGTISTDDVKIIDKERFCKLKDIIYFYRNYVSDKTAKILGNRLSSLYSSIIYGDNLQLDEDIYDTFKMNGIAHLLVISGTHIIILLHIIDYFISNSNLKKRILIKYLILIFFFILSYETYPVLRVIIYSFICDILNIFKIKLSKIIKMIFTVFIIYLKNPYCIFNIGFILSIMSVISIMKFYNIIYSYFDTRIMKYFNIRKYNKISLKKIIYFFVDLINKNISITLSAQILILPIILYSFGKINITMFLSGILVTGIMTFELLVGFLTLFFIFIPYISKIFINANYVLLFCIIKINEIVLVINIPQIELPAPSIFCMILYYYFIIYTSDIYYLKYINTSSFLKKVMTIFEIISIFSCIYIPFEFFYTSNFESYVIFFNVGQGNMALIHDKRKNVIIDIGSTTKNLSSNVISTFLKKKNIKKVDAILLTHMHSDHINGLYNVAKEFDIKRVIYSIPFDSNLEEYKKFNEFLKNCNIAPFEVTMNDTINLGNIDINIVFPINNKYIKNNDIENSNSIVCITTLKNKNYLFMGDATKNTEEYIIKNKDKLSNKIRLRLENINVIQIGHHGSKTSTTKMWIEYIKAKDAIISSRKKVYNHPSIETINKLLEYNINIKITEKCGSIKY